MKLKNDVVKDVLELIADRENLFEAPDWAEVASEHGEHAVLLAVALLKDAGYIRVVDSSSSMAANALGVPASLGSLGPARLTWSGRSQLSELRGDSSFPL